MLMGNDNQFYQVVCFHICLVFDIKKRKRNHFDHLFLSFGSVEVIRYSSDYKFKINIPLVLLIIIEWCIIWAYMITEKIRHKRVSISSTSSFFLSETHFRIAYGLSSTVWFHYQIKISSNRRLQPAYMVSDADAAVGLNVIVSLPHLAVRVYYCTKFRSLSRCVQFVSYRCKMWVHDLV